MTKLPQEIQSILKEIRFVTEGGSCFECCDYEGMVQQLGEVLQKHLLIPKEGKSYNTWRKEMFGTLLKEDKIKNKINEFQHNYSYAHIKDNDLEELVLLGAEYLHLPQQQEPKQEIEKIDIDSLRIKLYNNKISALPPNDATMAKKINELVEAVNHLLTKQRDDNI